MITIPITGIIASFEMDSESNVTPITLKKSLDAANGKDILITINSPGGSVFHGLEMFSLIKNYPGHTETRVISLAASMGSILALAGDEKTIENTAIYFIHNAQTVGVGDYRELESAAQWAKDVTNLLAVLYETYTTLSLKEAQKLMDADTQFFGKDLEGLGFRSVDTGNDLDASASRVNAKSRIKDIENKIPNEDMSNDFEKVAASIASKKNVDSKNANENLNLNDVQSKKLELPDTVGDQNNTQEVIMNLDELKSKHPDLYNEIYQAGVKAEKDRVDAHIQWMDSAPEAVKKAINDGEEFSNVHLSAYTKASMNISDLKDRDNDTNDTDTGTQNDVDNASADANIDAFGKGMSGGIDYDEEE